MIEEEIKNYGQILLSWDFPEYPQYQRGKSWHVISGSLLLFFIIYAIFTSNFLFAIILFLSGLVIFLNLKRIPLNVEFKIFEDGIMISSKFYEWTEIKNFHLAYRPPETKRLYFDLKKALIPDISVSLEKQNPLEVRKILKEYLEEDAERGEENIIDRINHWLKI
ncbi:MAG: DUF5673 domain-containing protein [Patescibacteria group bacterium]|jgi:hypothetical protein|nr:DUF5673 domain-containing protein [Patescibacteria group bacterium]MDD5172631.1 DUF5673 domain-containing protein [Patescibacteria group bacterium]